MHTMSITLPDLVRSPPNVPHCYQNPNKSLLALESQAYDHIKSLVLPGEQFSLYPHSCLNMLQKVAYVYISSARGFGFGNMPANLFAMVWLYLHFIPLYQMGPIKTYTNEASSLNNFDFSHEKQSAHDVIANAKATSRLLQALGFDTDTLFVSPPQDGEALWTGDDCIKAQRDLEAHLSFDFKINKRGKVSLPF